MSISYADSGVNKEEGYRTVDRIKALTAATHHPRVLSSIGAFGAFYDLSGYHNPVLVSGTDGVGTKLKIAFALQRYDSVGIDCVAMCVNDILCHGAAPQFFLDYLACGKLDAAIAADLVQGVATGCQAAGAALIGGETAEMPGFYQEGEYDIAGFAVGVVEKDKLIDGSRVQAGDVLIGLPSSGYHSNGFSLLRRILNDPMEKTENGQSIGEILLTPTKIYVRSVLAILAHHPVHGMAHITGGGLPENLPRAYAAGLCARVQSAAFPALPLMERLQREVTREECFATFNMGIGFVLIVPPEAVGAILQDFEQQGEKALVIGSMQEGSSSLIIE